jgi:hypothetical protein
MAPARILAGSKRLTLTLLAVTQPKLDMPSRRGSDLVEIAACPEGSPTQDTGPGLGELRAAAIKACTCGMFGVLR